MREETFIGRRGRRSRARRARAVDGYADATRRYRRLLLVAVIVDGIRPEQITHGTVRRWLVKSVQLEERERERG